MVCLEATWLQDIAQKCIEGSRERIWCKYIWVERERNGKRMTCLSVNSCLEELSMTLGGARGPCLYCIYTRTYSRRTPSCEI